MLKEHLAFFDLTNGNSYLNYKDGSSQQRRSVAPYAKIDDKNFLFMEITNKVKLFAPSKTRKLFSIVPPVLPYLYTDDIHSVSHLLPDPCVLVDVYYKTTVSGNVIIFFCFFFANIQVEEPFLDFDFDYRVDYESYLAKVRRTNWDADKELDEIFEFAGGVGALGEFYKDLSFTQACQLWTTTFFAGRLSLIEGAQNIPSVSLLYVDSLDGSSTDDPESYFSTIEASPRADIPFFGSDVVWLTAIKDEGNSPNKAALVRKAAFDKARADMSYGKIPHEDLTEFTDALLESFFREELIRVFENPMTVLVMESLLEHLESSYQSHKNRFNQILRKSRLKEVHELSQEIAESRILLLDVKDDIASHNTSNDFKIKDAPDPWSPINKKELAGSTIGEKNKEALSLVEYDKELDKNLTTFMSGKIGSLSLRSTNIGIAVGALIVMIPTIVDGILSWINSL